MLTVTIREKDGGERRLVFNQEEVTLGRSDGCDIVLPKNNISKRHARFVDKEERVVLVDLRSTNGTYVNGRRITAPEVLNTSDKVYIGDFVLLVDVGAEQAELESTSDGSGEAIRSTQAFDPADLSDLAQGLTPEDLDEDQEQQADVEPATAQDEQADGDDDEPTETVDLDEGESAEGEGYEVAEVTGDTDLGGAAEAVEEEATEAAEEEATEAAEEEADDAAEEEQPVDAPTEKIADRGDDAEDPVEADLHAHNHVDDVGEERAYNSTLTPSGLEDAVGSTSSDDLPLGSAGFRALVDDPLVSCIQVSAPGRVLLVRQGARQWLGRAFADAAEVDRIASELAEELGFDGDGSPSLVEGVLESGASVHIVGPPLTTQGTVITISRGASGAGTLGDLVGGHSLTQEGADFLAEALSARRNIIVAGPAGSGRSSMVSALLGTAGDGERRLVVTEDGCSDPHAMILDGRAIEAHGEDFVELAGRLGAERVVIDPVRPDQIYGWITLALAGHDGLVASMHGGSGEELLRRLCLQLEFAMGARLEQRALAMVAEAVGVVVTVQRVEDGFRVGEILDVQGTGEDALAVRRVV